MYISIIFLEHKFLDSLNVGIFISTSQYIIDAFYILDGILKMSEFIIYHNPRCSMSRETLALLEENNITPTIREYLKTPPTVDELTQLLQKLQLNAKDIIRTKEAEYKANNLEDGSDEQLLSAISQFPKLLERPIVIHKQQAVIGRPPENVLALVK
jgi:arsenate reductase